MGKDKYTAQVVRKQEAKPVINRDLPPIPDGLAADAVTLVLFYQYMEPKWTNNEHKKARSFVIGLGEKLGVTGRGRCAAEGLNCTLTGTPDAVRKFCLGLREWKPIFKETDFKLTDGLAPNERFKALTIRKTDELVAYGLAGEAAPSLDHNDTLHVEATKYHKMMTKPNTVIIDVRNAYESAIGHFQPPPGGAKLLDPKMRNSIEFPKWLNAPDTQKELSGKNIMMYCTGGIRCERASALLGQLAEATPEFDPKKVVMLRGGIERYMKTYPEGGFWKGKNFLFDRRFEQVPQLKAKEALDADVESTCCLCSTKCAEYRGQHSCAAKDCKVPVIVCPDCQAAATNTPQSLKCPLCVEGYQLRDLARPDAAKLQATYGNKRKAEASAAGGNGKKQKPQAEASERVHVGKMPLLVDATQLKAALGAQATVTAIEWLRDKQTRLFYGSAFVKLGSVTQATSVVKNAATGKVVVKGRKLRVGFAPLKEGQVWPAPDHQELERPPVT